MADSKKPHFPAPPILNIFSWNFYGLVLGLIKLINAKGINVAQLIWSWLRLSDISSKTVKKCVFWHYKVVSNCKWKIGQIFAAFYEYLNFTVKNWTQNSSLKGLHMPIRISDKLSGDFKSKALLSEAFLIFAT